MDLTRRVGRGSLEAPVDVYQCQLGFSFQGVLLCMQTHQLTCSLEFLSDHPAL